MWKRHNQGVLLFTEWLEEKGPPSRREIWPNDYIWCFDNRQYANVSVEHS